MASTGSPWPGLLYMPPTPPNRVRWFSLKRAPFSPQSRAADAAPRPGHVTRRSGLSSPPLSVLPSQGSMSAVWPHPVSLQRCLSPQCRLLFSEREKARERKGENNNLQELVIPVFHLPRPAARRGAAFAVGMCCYNNPASYFL